MPRPVRRIFVFAVVAAVVAGVREALFAVNDRQRVV
jgi:hypothetical protein